MAEFSKSAPSQDESLRRAVLVGQSAIVNTLLFLALSIYLVVTTGSWQSYAFAVWLIVGEVLAFTGTALIRRGQMNSGGWVFLGAYLFGANFVAFLFVSLGYVAAAYILVTAYFTIRYVLPRESHRLAIGISIIGFVFSILAEVINLAWRQVSQLVLTLSPIFTAILGLAFIVVVVRQAWSGSIRNRLVSSFLVLVVFPLAASAIISTIVLRRATFNDVYEHLSSTAALKENSVNKWVGTMEDTLRFVYHTRDENAIADTLLSEDTTMGTLANIQNDLNVIVSQTKDFQELFILDLYGRVVVSTDSTDIGKMYDNQEFFRKGQADIFIQPPQYSQSLGEIVVIVSKPLRTAGGKVGGVLAGRANLATLNAIMSEDIGVGQTGETYLVRTNHALLTNSKFEGYPAGDTYIRTQGVDNALDQFSNDTASYVGYRGTQVLGAYRWLPDLELVLVAEVEQGEALQTAITSTITNAGVAVGAAIIAVLVALYVTRTIANPLGELASAAGRLATGDLDVSVEVDRGDEIGVLAGAFNNMARQLTDLIATLERRVAERTKAIATSSEVSRRLSTILNQRELVIEVVEQVKEAFGYYHAHIYLYDNEKEELVMAGGTGDVGAALLANGHKVPKGKGLVGRAAETNETVLVPDTSQDPDWLPNPLLPDTKSEVAIPISVGDQVLGVLDVQHDEANSLDEEDVEALNTIANQVAVAMQNIESAELVAKRAKELETVASISTATATIPDSFEMLATMVHLTQRGFGLYHAHVFTYQDDKEELQIVACGYKEGDEHEGTHGTSAIPIAQKQSLVARAARTRQSVIVNDVRNEPGWLPNPLLPDTRAELAVPMIVGNQLLGVLDVQSDHVNAFTEEDAHIQMTLASQVATALQNARSYTLSQKQAEREVKLNTIAQKIQSTATIEDALKIATRELGHALGKRQTMVALEPSAFGSNAKSSVNE